jgi:transposase
MTHPDWVLKHRTKGTHVIRRGENYYLYRVTSVWNREKGRAQLKTEKYLGKITPDGLIPPRQERMLGRLRQATIKEYGASFLVNHLAGDIIELLKGEYQEWRELFSFAALRLLHNAHIKNLEFHYETSFLSELVPDADLSDRRVGGMLRDVGMDRETMTSFMRNFVSGGGYAAIDLTHVLSLSEGVISSTLGHNSAGEHLPQVNVSYLFSLDRMMPSYFRMLVGSAGSVSSLALTVKESGATDIVLVGDKGFHSAANVAELEEARMSYILPLRRDSTLIDYGGMKSGMKSFTHFLFQGRPIWFRARKRGKRSVFLFFDRSLATEEEKDMLLRADREKGRGKHNAMKVYFAAQHRMGTIAVLTGLDEGGERIFELLKSRVDIEQLYDTFKNTIHADRSYMRDDYQLNGWLFVNFIAMMLYYRIYNLLVSHKMLRKYSPMDVIEHLSRVQMLRVDSRWIMTELPKKTREIIAQLEIPIIQN